MGQVAGDQWVIVYRLGPTEPYRVYDSVYCEEDQRHAIKACMDRYRLGAVVWASDALRTPYPKDDRDFDGA